MAMIRSALPTLALSHAFSQSEFVVSGDYIVFDSGAKAGGADEMQAMSLLSTTLEYAADLERIV